MPSFGYCILTIIPVWISYINVIVAEITINVDKDHCGGSMNLDKIQLLRLNYYGAELGSNICLYNVSSYNTDQDKEMCIYNHDYESWTIACGSSLTIHLGTYPGYDFPSRHHCTSFKPLCSGEKRVFLEFQYDRALHIMGMDVNIKFDIYLRNKPETTIKPHLTTRLPSISSKGRGTGYFSITWIILIAMGSVMAFIFCSALLFYCCCSNDKEDQTQSEGDQQAEGNAESLRMMETPVVHVPPENIQSFSTDPPDYYAVCGGSSQYSCSDKNFKEQKLMEEKVIPSAPPQPSAPLQSDTPPPYHGYR